MPRLGSDAYTPAAPRYWPAAVPLAALLQDRLALRYTPRACQRGIIVLRLAPVGFLKARCLVLLAYSIVKRYELFKLRYTDSI